MHYKSIIIGLDAGQTKFWFVCSYEKSESGKDRNEGEKIENQMRLMNSRKIKMKKKQANVRILACPDPFSEKSNNGGT